jgi:hypothetical protein
MKKELRKQINIRLDDKIMKTVRKLCIDLEMSFADAIEEAMKEWIQAHSPNR